MGGATELLEKMEHAGHAGHEDHGDKGHGDGGHKASGKGIGITMAIIGVLLALCAAMVGSERTELVKTMVEQSNVFNEYQAASTKYRLLMSQLQSLYAATPSRTHTKEFEGRFDALPQKAEQAELAASLKFTAKELVGLLTPRASEVKGFIETIERYQEERKEVKEWAESFEDAVDAHFKASEWYEKAQLASEIGIVIASIALLMGSRPFWFVAMAAGAACVAIIAFTFVTTSRSLNKTCDEKDTAHPVMWERHHKGGAHGGAPEPNTSNMCMPGAEQKIEHEKEGYEELRAKKDEATGKRIADLNDDALIEKVRERYGIPVPEHAAPEHGARAAPEHGDHAAPHAPEHAPSAAPEHH